MTRPFRKYPRGKYWKQQSEACYSRARGVCEITGVSLIRRWACHHIIAERFARRWIRGCNPHILENLVAITPSLHSKITAIEAKLNKTDWLGFRTELHRLGFPLERLDAAFRALCESAK
jgi:hypothetical protein